LVRLCVAAECHDEHGHHRLRTVHNRILSLKRHARLARQGDPEKIKPFGLQALSERSATSRGGAWGASLPALTRLSMEPESG
jgi:hypothetical protein